MKKTLAALVAVTTIAGSLAVAPAAKADRTSRSTLTLGSPASSFATLDWLDPSRSASSICVKRRPVRSFRSRRASASLTSTNCTSACERFRNSLASATRQPEPSSFFRFAARINPPRNLVGNDSNAASRHRSHVLASLAFSSRTLPTLLPHRGLSHTECASSHSHRSRVIHGNLHQSWASAVTPASRVVRLPATCATNSRPQRAPVRKMAESSPRRVTRPAACSALTYNICQF